MTINKDEKNQPRSLTNFPFYRFKGTPRQIGQQHGEACASLIHQHLDLALGRLSAQYQVTADKLAEVGLQYQAYVSKYAPFLHEEIEGIAEGANISLNEAYLLQIRAELNKLFQPANECTTFAISAEATTDGSPLIGQNADLPSFYSKVGIVMECKADDGSAILMLTPAGQVSYIGINNVGLGVFANFINCAGWRVGLPRYMYSRLALTCSTVQEAISKVSQVYRASSRNLIMLDKRGGMADVETTPTKVSVIEAEQGLLAHSNHFISPDLLDEERASGKMLENSQVRLERMYTLLKEKHGQLNVQVMQEILRDRGSYPHCLCQIPGDEGMQSPGDHGADIITFASVIAEPAKGNLWVAMGPPNKYEYHCFNFSS